MVQTALQIASDNPLLQQDVVDALELLSYPMGVQTSQTVLNGSWLEGQPLVHGWKQRSWMA